MPEIPLVGSLFANLAPAEKGEGASEGSIEPQGAGVDAVGTPFSPILAQFIAAQIALLKGGQSKQADFSDMPQLTDGETENIESINGPVPGETSIKVLADATLPDLGPAICTTMVSQMPFIGGLGMRLSTGEQGQNAPAGNLLTPSILELKKGLDASVKQTLESAREVTLQIPLNVPKSEMHGKSSPDTNIAGEEISTTVIPADQQPELEPALTTRSTRIESQELLTFPPEVAVAVQQSPVHSQKIDSQERKERLTDDVPIQDPSALSPIPKTEEQLAGRVSTADFPVPSMTRPEVVVQGQQPIVLSQNSRSDQEGKIRGTEPPNEKPSVSPTVLEVAAPIAVRAASALSPLPSLMMVSSSRATPTNSGDDARRSAFWGLGTAAATEIPQGTADQKVPGVLMKPEQQTTPEPSKQKDQKDGPPELKSFVKQSSETTGKTISESPSNVRTSDAIRWLANLPVEEMVVVKNETAKPQSAFPTTPVFIRPKGEPEARVGAAILGTTQPERVNSLSSRSTEDSQPGATVGTKSNIGQSSSGKEAQTESNQKDPESNEPTPAAKGQTRLNGAVHDVVDSKSPVFASTLAAKDHPDALKHQVTQVSPKVDLRQDVHEASFVKPLPMPSELLSSVHNQIAKEIALKVAGTVSEIRVMLKPESLGSVAINVRMEEGTMVARIDVSQQNVRSALEGNLSQLRETLVSKGIQVDRIDITASAFASSRESNPQQRERGKTGLKRADDVEAVESYDSARYLGYNTMDYLV